MTEAEQSGPVAAGPVRPRHGAPSRALTSPLLRLDSGASQADREKLVYAVNGRVAVLVELDVSHGISVARRSFLALFTAQFTGPDVIAPVPIARQYVRCLLTHDEIRQLGEADHAGPRSIFRIWPDYRLIPHIDRSAATVKADAAARSYGTSGEGVVWAVIDSGVDESHPHFSCPDVGPNLTDDQVASLHRDFTPLLASNSAPGDDPKPALTDALGHGTHVAGIIAGAMPPRRP